MIVLSKAQRWFCAEVNLASRLWASPPKTWDLFLWDNSGSCTPPPLSALPWGYQILVTFLLLRTQVFSDWIMCWGKKRKKRKQLVQFAHFLLFHTVLAFILSLAFFTLLDPTSRHDSCFGYKPIMHSTALSWPIASLKFSSMLSCIMPKFIHVTVSPSCLAF